jgi:DNA-binding Lrp family transcriptional regulator
MSETENGAPHEHLDAELLNAVQWDFPLTAAPYAALGDRLGISEDDVLTRLRAAKDAGVLRQLSAIFDTRALGYSSALVAAKIDPDRVDDAAAVISRHPGVSHNYKRNHAYNLWYTLAVPPGDDIDEHLEVLHRESGSLVTRKLPRYSSTSDRNGAPRWRHPTSTISSSQPSRSRRRISPTIPDRSR